MPQRISVTDLGLVAAIRHSRKQPGQMRWPGLLFDNVISDVPHAGEGLLRTAGPRRVPA